MRIIFFILALVLPLALLPQPGLAQSYQPWNNPDSQSEPSDARLKDFQGRLGRLIDKAEKDRAADPRFLQDLRDLATGITGPVGAQLLSDDFSDGDFTANPAWTVTQGRYWVEKGWGLRSAVNKQAAPEQRRTSGKDVAAAIFGQILQQAIDPEGRSATGGAASGNATAAAIQTTASISNAFSLEMAFSSWKPQGRLDIAAYNDTADYVLSYQPGGTVTLSKASPGGSNVINSGIAPALEDKKTHLIQWTRMVSGRMRVAIDGKEVLNATDRGTRTPFQGLRLVNRGGDYIIKRITVSGTR